MERVYGRHVASSIDSIKNHIQKHDLEMSIGEYIMIADMASKGREGKHFIEYNGRHYIVITRGIVCRPDPRNERITEVYTLVRSIWRGKPKHIH